MHLIFDIFETSNSQNKCKQDLKKKKTLIITENFK